MNDINNEDGVIVMVIVIVIVIVMIMMMMIIMEMGRRMGRHGVSERERMRKRTQWIRY